MRVAIRTDASAVIGTGHFMRCLVLADGLKQQGADVTLLYRSSLPALLDLAVAGGHAVLQLPPAGGAQAQDAGVAADVPAHAAWLGVTQPRDAADTVAALASSTPWDWLVVDHYGIDATWESAVRPAARRLMVIDDLADRRHECDVLLDQNVQGTASRYDALVPSHCLQLLGPAFALLRPEFALARAGTVARKGAVHNLLICFGGVDAGGATLSALDGVALLPVPPARIDVVVGRGHSALDEVQARCARIGAHCHVQTTRLAELMAAADLAIGAGGTVLWERCVTGLPALALCAAENQRGQLAEATALGIVHAPSIGENDAAAIARHVQVMSESVHWREAMSRNGMALVDGLGHRRVAGVLVAEQSRLRIRMRPATSQDSDSLFEWRNHPSIRAVSRDDRPIRIENHRRWLEGALASDARALLIGADDEGPVGVVRFDIHAEVAEISIYVVPGREGRGLGRALLGAAQEWLEGQRPAVARIDAEVLEGNTASHRLFAAAGFQRAAHRYSKRIRA